MKMELFDIDLFLKRYSKQIDNIETKQIYDWIGCSVRYVQKYAKKNNIPFHRINGRKYYIWNEDNIFKFSVWYNSKREKIEIKPEEKTVCNVIKPVKKIKKEKMIPFKTIQDIVNENEDTKKRKKTTRIKNIRKWANENNLPFSYLYGRKYYIMNDELFELYKLSEIENK